MMRLLLKDRASSRATLARLIRAYHADQEADPVRFKAILTALNLLLQFDRAAEEGQLLERIEQLELFTSDPARLAGLQLKAQQHKQLSGGNDE